MGLLKIFVTSNEKTVDYEFMDQDFVVLGSGVDCDVLLGSRNIFGNVLQLKVKNSRIILKCLSSQTQLLLDGAQLPYMKELIYEGTKNLNVAGTDYQLRFTHTEEVTPPPFNLSETELEIQHLKTKREEVFLEIERTRQKNKDEEDKYEFMQERARKEKDREDVLQRSIAEKDLVLKGLHLERERLESDIRREQDHYDEIRQEKNVLLKDLQILEDRKHDDNREHSHKVDLINSVSQKIDELSAILKNVEDEIVLKVQQEKDYEARIFLLNEQIQSEELSLSAVKDEARALHKGLEKEKVILKLLQDQVGEEGHKEKTLKHLNEELRLELMRVEGKLADRRNSFHQLEFDAQELSRKIQDHQRDIEGKERCIQDNKRLIIKEEDNLREMERNLKDFRENGQREKKHLTDDFQEEKSRFEREIKRLEDKLLELDGLHKNLSSNLIHEKDKIKEAHAQYEKAKKSKAETEDSLHKFVQQRDQLSEEKDRLQLENQVLLKKKTNLEYEISLFNIKFLDNEAQFKEQQKEAHLEIENMKRAERARLAQERNSLMSEVEALKKKTLSDLETNGDSVLTKAKMEADTMVTKARLFEQDVMTKSQARMREANEEAERRDRVTFERFEEAEKKLSGLNQIYDEKKGQVKSHLHSLEEKGERHQKTLRESQENKLKKEEKYFMERLEKQKRREFKRVAVVRNEELAKREENLKATQKEMMEKRKNELQKLARLKEKLHAELELEKEKQLQELNLNKKSVMEQMGQSRREKEERWVKEMEREKENFDRTKKDRVSHAVSAVYHLVLSQKNEERTDEDFKKQVEAALTQALNGQYHETQEKSAQILTSNMSERKKILPVAFKYFIRFGLPAAALGAVAMDLGHVRSGSLAKIETMIKQEKSAQDIFVKNQHDEWKQKYTFNPEMTPGYKESYVDNVLYTKDFVAVMEKEDFQNSWILALHEYIVKELELSEEVAISFISSEGSMVKEMDTLRRDINPQILDVGINKLKEIEKKFEQDVVAKIPDQEKLAKFKEFRKKYYEEYVEKLGNREIAAEKK